VPWLHLPGTGTFDGDGFALSMVVPASPAGDFAVHALDLRVRQLVRHGVCEAAEVRVQPVSLQQDHVSLLISCDRAHVPNLGSWLIDQVELLGREALALIEFREWLASFEDRVRDPGGSIAMVQREAERLLMGGQPQDFETQLEERRQVHPSEPAVVLRDALGSLLMLVPDTIGWHDPRLPLLPDASGLVVHGRRLSARGAEPPGSAWTIGVDGISWLPGRGMVARTVHYATCEAMLIEPAGARTLVDRDGTSLHIDPADWKDADTIVKLLDSSISHDRWGHVEAATGA
jgi:hypothetical protein